ncbi:MAG TPA: undecaprenyl-diphosphate phosphatase [bacterium]|jgi:undecaprenyl-diphosphatase
MTLPDAVLLGIIQGLTEFLPVSSSGHLAVFQYLLGLTQPMLTFDVLLHVGSLIAILAFFRKQIIELAISVFAPSREPGSRRLLGLIIVASIPTALIGLGYKDFVETQFESPAAVGMFWLLTAGLLFGVSKMMQGSKQLRDITIPDALLIGLFQGVAILPGVSRSGATLVMGMLCGLHPKAAANFSFLIAIPAILGAIFLQRHDLAGVMGPDGTATIVGTVVSMIVSYLAIWILMKLLQRRVIQPFAWYLLFASALVLFALKTGFHI